MSRQHTVADKTRTIIEQTIWEVSAARRLDIPPDLVLTLTQVIVAVVEQQPGITADATRGLTQAIMRTVEREWAQDELAIDPSMLETLRGGLDTVSDDRRVDEDASFVARWGSAPRPDQVSAARLAGEAMRRDAMAAVLNGALTRDQAAERLGITAQAVSERLKARTLTAIRRGREWRFPAWQFTDDATLPALKQLIEAWPGTELSLSAWASKPSVDLDGRSPANQLAHGNADRVIHLVEAIAAAGW